MFSKVSLTIGVCGNASNTALGEILSLALRCSWPSHITTVGLISLERAEYTLARGLERDSWEPALEALRVVEDPAIVGVVLRLRDSSSPRPWLRDLCHLYSEDVASAVVGRDGFERVEERSWDDVAGAEKI